MSDRIISYPVQLACVQREVALRRRAYPKWVAAGRMTQEQADTGILHMGAVEETLRRLVQLAQSHDEMAGRPTRSVSLAPDENP